MSFNSLLLIFASFWGGVISSLSPCSIAILPLILAYICGTQEKKNSVIAVKLLSFSAGLSSVLGIIGLLCAFTGRAFAGFNLNILLIIFASILMVLGLQLIEVLDIQMPAFVKKIPQGSSSSLFLYPFLIGILFAFLASPCSSPVLLAIMATAAVSSDYLTSFLMLFAFAFGQCFIIILAGIFASFLKNLQKLQKYSSILMKISGWIFIISSIFIWYGIYTNI